MLNAKYDASTHPEKDPNKSLSQMNVCCLFFSERERGRERSDLFCKDFCSDNYIRSICSLQKPVNVVTLARRLVARHSSANDVSPNRPSVGLLSDPIYSKLPKNWQRQFRIPVRYEIFKVLCFSLLCHIHHSDQCDQKKSPNVYKSCPKMI